MLREGNTELTTKEIPEVWQLRCLQSICQWFDGRVIPIGENYRALSYIIGNSTEFPVL